MGRYNSMNILIDTTRCSKEEYDFITAYLKSESFNFKKVSRVSGTKESLIQKISEMKELLNSKDSRIASLIHESASFKYSNKQEVEISKQKEEIVRLNREIYNLQDKKTTDEIERVTNQELTRENKSLIQELTRENKSLIVELADSKNLNESLTCSLIEVSKKIK